MTILLLAFITSVTAIAQNGHDLLQKALRKERVDGDVKGAIELYQQIVKDHGANRALAAQALVQIGKGFEKLGAAEARSAYEKVISEYADQAKEVAEAKERLTALGREVQPGGADGHLVVQKVVELDTFGRPSPDGRYISFVNWGNGNLAIYDIKTGEKRDVTKEGNWSIPAFCNRSIWSPDGRQIAYFWWFEGSDGDLRIIERSGGKPRILAPLDEDGSVYPKDWSADGRYIVGLAHVSVTGGTGKAPQIVLVEVTTGAIRAVKDLPASERGAAFRISLAISPDGNHIAYDVPAGEIRIVSTDGSADRVLIDHPAKDSAPRWLPEGKHLLFLSDRSGKDALWSVPIKQGEAVGEATLVRDLENQFHPMTVTEDGTLYYSMTNPRRNVYVAEVDFEAAVMKPPRLVSLRFDGRNERPQWSADGSKLAYVSRRSGTGDTLVLQETATGKEQDIEIPLKRFEAISVWAWPQWASDGARMVVRAAAKGRNGHALYTLDVQSGHCALIVDKNGALWGNFSPDGRHVIYVSERRIVEQDLKTGQERVIRHHEASDSILKLLLSPDGSRLAFFKTARGTGTHHTQTALMITSTNDGETQTVWEFFIGEGFADLDWLSDSRRLLVATADKEGTQQLHVVDTQTKTHRLFGNPLRGADRIQHLAVHPDGSRIAFTRNASKTEIWAMKNILPEEKRAAK